MTEEEIAAIAALIGRNIRTVDRSIVSYVSTLRLLMQAKILRELSEVPGDRNLRRAEVLRLLGGLEAIVMEDQEVEEHISTLQDIFDLQSRLSEQVYARADREFVPMPSPSRATQSRLAVFANAREQNVEIMARAYANEVRQALADAIISGAPVSDFQVAQVSASRIFQAVESDLKTAAASYQRIEALGINSKYVLYAGPRDSRNRPFCAEHVNNIYPTEVVYTWDNGQGIPAYLYCGGYGCRHQLVPTNTPPRKR